MFPAAELSLIDSFMLEQNIPRAHWLLGTGLKAFDIDQPIDFVSLDQLNIIYRNISRLSGHADIGLKLGLKLNISRWGVLGFAMLSARTLEHALLTGRRYLPLVHSRFEMSPDIIEQHLVIKLQPSAPMPFATNTMFSYEVALGSIVSNISDMLSRPFTFDRIQLPYASPQHNESYTQLCSQALEFNCTEAKLWLPLETLTATLKLSNSICHEQAARSCEAELQRLRQQQSGDIIWLIKHEFAKHPNNIPSLDVLAQKMQLSPRTLRRRLTQAGSCYRDVVKQYQLERAMQGLSDRHADLNEIAKRCGFRAYPGFSEAFKRWTNMTPSEYRSQLN